MRNAFPVMSESARDVRMICPPPSPNEPSMLSMEVIIHRALRNATGRLLFNRLGAIVQFETEIRAERPMDGIQKVRERDVHFGSKKRLTVQQIAELGTDGIKV